MRTAPLWGLILTLALTILNTNAPAAEEERILPEGRRFALEIHEAGVITMPDRAERLPDFVYQELRDPYIPVYRDYVGRGQIFVHADTPRPLQIALQLARRQVRSWWPQAARESIVDESINLTADPMILSWQAFDGSGGDTTEHVDQKHWFERSRVAGDALRVGRDTESFLLWEAEGFERPLRLLGAGGIASARNTGNETLYDVIILRRQDGELNLQYKESLEPGECMEAVLLDRHGKTSSSSADALLRDCSLRAGLDPAEADALLSQWSAAFFDGNGTRVLYRLDADTVAALYPMRVSEQDAALTRVWWVCQGQCAPALPEFSK